MRSRLARAAAVLLVTGAFAAGVTLAQSPAANPAEADLAKQQAQRQQVQPGNNEPVWKEVRAGLPQYTTAQGRGANVLIQPEGQTWRAVRVPIAQAGGAIIALVLLALFGYYSWRGSIPVTGPATGRPIERFTPVERAAHWTMGLSFAVLAVTGLVVTFGKSILLPLIGYTLFSWLATVAKTVHNFVGPIFTVALPVFIAIYLRHNVPRGHDAQWLAKFGGMLDRSGHTHVPSGKFNAGEKALFWLLVVVLNITLVVTGLILEFPNFNQSRQTMQTTNVIHMVAALLAIAMACFHIYLGTVGMKGAYEAMRYGYVDESWAKEHHELWYRDVLAGKEPGKVEPDRVKAALVAMRGKTA